MKQEPKKIEIVSGDGSDLQISPVYEHLNLAKPSTKDSNKSVVIPKEKAEIKKETQEKLEKMKKKKSVKKGKDN